MSEGSPLPPNQQLVSGDRWPVVGEREPASEDGAWTITLCGEVPHTSSFPLSELMALPMTDQQLDLHCVTRWSKLQVRFSGIPLLQLIEQAFGCGGWLSQANFVSFTAHSDRNHSTSLSLDEVLKLNPLVAFQAEGRPLDPQHGGPVRLVVPGKYFYKSLKWLRRIEFLKEDRLGYWEAEAGYHNHADPWAEERYVASNIDKRLASSLIAERNFSNRDLLGLNVSLMDLSGLVAHDARLRNSDFQSCSLRNADFSNANLSNACFRQADLRGATFHRADAEGADFSGTDLRQVDFTGASLFGTSFLSTADSSGDIIENLDSDQAQVLGATIDSSTRISDEQLSTLVADQRRYVESRMSRAIQ